jgi:hypothetical protein
MRARADLSRHALRTLALAAFAAGCGGEDAPAAMNADGVMMPVPQPAMPIDPGTAGTGPAMTPMQGGAPAQPPVQTAGTGGTPAEQPPAAGMAAPPDPPDECDGFVVSRAKPCHDDPNPCNIDSGFAGDEYCLPPPAEGEGIQVHFGPSDYTDMAEVAQYLLQPGEEFNDYGLAHVPTSETRFYNRIVYQMRPGSHHLINSLVEGHPTPGFQPGGAGCPGTRVGSLGGTQNLIYDSRPNGIVPPENEGLGYQLPGNSSICFNFHRYNTTEQAQLSEIWVNIYFVDEAEVTQRASWGAIIGGLGLRIPPGDEQELTYSHEFTSAEPNARIIQLFGHRHAATYRYAAWLNDQLIYDSWDWVESVTYNYDSLTQNPPIDPAMMRDGGHSGVLPVKTGDVLKYTCFVRNETENTLTFANELYTGEMCNLFGQSVGARFFGTFF